MDDTPVADVRAFNRFYTRQIGLLGERFSDSPLSLAEARVLYEIDAHGHTTARELVRSLRIDPGYLSRMLGKFVDAGLLSTSPTVNDRRSNTVALTTDGDIIVDRLNERSNDAVDEFLDPLTPDKKARLVEAMRTIRRILGDEMPVSPVILRPYRIGELGWLVHRQGLLYNQQYGWNGEFEALIARIYNEYASAPGTPAKNLWIAEQNGEIAGSVFLVPSDGIDGSAQLRMLYVEPAARGQGIGGLLVDQCIAFARAAGYARMRLWTHAIQTAARRLYAAAGFKIVEEWDHESFGKQLHAEIWELWL